MLIVLDGLSRPVSLERCERLVPALAAVLGTWRFEVVPAHDQEPVLRVRQERHSYRIESPWLEAPVMESSDAGAIFSIVAELILAFVDEQPQSLCLHCGAVECGGRLIVFPNTEQAGKSTLLAQLASDNQRVFADDALPLSAEGTRGMALGIAPRLRLPLPANASSEFQAFVEVHRGLSDHESLYLALPPGLLAPYCTTAPIGAVVLLDRKMSGAPRLEPTPRGQGLQRLIIQNFARAGTSLASIDVLHALMQRVPCFTLAYSDLQDAAELFLDRFAVPFPHESELMIDLTPVDSGLEMRITTEIADSGALRFEQASDIVLRELDGDLFLKRPHDDAVFHLNPVAAILWRLLEQPVSLAAAATTLREVFPQTAPDQIRRDVKKAFDDLHAGGLIRANDPDARG